MTADPRAQMIEAAERLLEASPDYDIATRAVCEAVGVTQPVLYRLFGDKRGLLDALADDGFRRYAAEKAAREQTDDPVADLLAGWDHHLRFAREHPALYQLMFAPRPQSHARARDRITTLLEQSLTRCSGLGALRMSPREAARLILPANIGLALSMLAEPGLFDDPHLSHRMRDAVFAPVLTDATVLTGAKPVSPAAVDPAGDPLRAAALRLRSQLAVGGSGALEPAEAALLDRWLERLSQ